MGYMRPTIIPEYCNLMVLWSGYIDIVEEIAHVLLLECLSHG